jgi:hypothetical protein
MSDKELYDDALEKAIRLTSSTIGFFHQVSEDQQTITLTTWNAEALRSCTAAYDTHYPLAQAGNWVDCVRLKKPIIYNDFQRSPNQRGLPEGHAVLLRFMSIPVMVSDRVRLIFGVGNKSTPYDDEDLTQVQLVANELHKIMMQRRAEEALRQANAELEQRVADRTRKLNQANAQLEHIAMEDTLTGLYNRRQFNLAPELEIHRLRRSGEYLSIIMADVDFFKLCNDHYGHLAGDTCACGRSPTSFATPSGAPATRSPGMAARNSRSSCPFAGRTWPCGWRNGCARRWGRKPCRMNIPRRRRLSPSASASMAPR